MVTLLKGSTRVIVKVELDIHDYDKHEAYVKNTLCRTAREIEEQCRRGFQKVEPLDF